MVDLGDIGTLENSSNVDKFLRNIADGTVPVGGLPVVDESSPNVDKLLNYIATNGAIGGGTRRVGVWFSDTTAPSTTTPQGAEEGDYYLNTTDKKYYIKDATQTTGWRELGTLQGVGTEDISELFSGEGTPDRVGHIGDNYDHHLDTTNGDIWKKENGIWRKLLSLMGQPGVAGQRGETGPQGAAGKAGTTWHVGNQPPADTVNDGDLHLAANGDVSKEVNGQWIPQNVNLKGSKGDKGDPGQAGSNTNISSQGTIKYPSIERTYQTGWTDAYGSTEGMVRYYKTGEMVNMHGIVYGISKPSNTYGQVIFTLSAGYRPKYKMFFPVATFNTFTFDTPNPGIICIEANGQVKFYGGYAHLISLAGITFTTAH